MVKRNEARARSVPVQSRRPVSIPTSLPSPSISDEKKIYLKNLGEKRRGSLNNINKMRKNTPLRRKVPVEVINLRLIFSPSLFQITLHNFPFQNL